MSFCEASANSALTYYFAYGANMDSGTFSSRLGHAADIQDLGPAILDGFGFAFSKISNSLKKRKAVANVQPEKGASTQGVVYRFAEELLTDLDKHELYPVHYNRQQLDVTISTTNEVVKAWVYFAQTDWATSGYNLAPKPDYYTKLQKACAARGLKKAAVDITSAFADSLPNLTEEDSERFEAMNKKYLAKKRAAAK